MRNNIINRLMIFGLIAGLVMMAASSCEKESALTVVKPAISITSSDILFGPDGGEGNIGFECDDQVTAYSEQPWCAVSVDGKTVSVTAEPYDDLENRYSSIILKSGADSIRVVAQQNGVVMYADVPESYALSDDGDEISFTVTSNRDVKVKSSSAWIRCVASGRNVTVTVRKNDEGHVRTGWFAYSSGNVADTVKVSQASVADLYGNYRLMGYSSNNSLVYLPASISAGEAENELLVTCTPQGNSWQFKAMFDPQTHKVVVANGNDTGMWAVQGINFHIFLCMLSSRNNTFNWDSGLSCELGIEYDETTRTTRMDLLPFAYDNGAGETVFDSWVFAAFQNVDPETGLPKGAASAYPAILYTPYFQSL